MPYISDRSRREVLIEKLMPVIKELCLGNQVIDGEVNFVITTLLLNVMRNTSYEGLERNIGLLECVKLEFYRRMVAPYEDHKIIVNGDVYPTP